MYQLPDPSQTRVTLEFDPVGVVEAVDSSILSPEWGATVTFPDEAAFLMKTSVPASVFLQVL